jgi:hypothetical protein
MSVAEVPQGAIGVVFDDLLTENGSPADITGNTGVELALVSEDGTPTLTRTATVVAVNPAHITYTTVAGDLDTSGSFRQQWHVTYPGGVDEWYPDEPNIIVVTAPAITPLGPRTEPDPWITWQDVDNVGNPAALGPVGQGIVLQAASDLMWQLSGRQFGLWRVTARPIPFCGHYMAWAPAWWGYPGWAAPSAQHWRPCSCNYYPYVHLGRAPIASIQSVRVDGAVVDPSTYRVDEHNYLVHLDGTSWPMCSNLLDASDQPGVFEVSWTYGVQVPVTGKTACALLAVRLSYELAEDEACAIPVNASNVTAEGVTIRLDTSAMAENGRTGMLIPDMWLESVCPGGPKKMGGGFDPGGRKEFWRVGT